MLHLPCCPSFPYTVKQPFDLARDHFLTARALSRTSLLALKKAERDFLKKGKALLVLEQLKRDLWESYAQYQEALWSRVYVSTIVTENLIKALYALDRNEQPKYTHNVKKLYKSLSKSLQDEIRAVYAECKIWTLEDKPDMATLEEFLKWNEKTIKDAKYNLRSLFSPNVDGKPIPCGIEHRTAPMTGSHVSEFPSRLLGFTEKKLLSKN